MFYMQKQADMLLKAFCAAGLAGLLWLYRQDGVLIWLNASILALTLVLIYLQWVVSRKIPPAGLVGSSLRHYLQEVVGFFHKQFARSLYNAAFSGPLIFYVGVLYYVWFKYGAMRKLDYVESLGEAHTVCIGNGRNDILMLERAAVGIAVVLGEGAFAGAVAAADIVCSDILSALELIVRAKRLQATLRN